jgi:hypothetical protein
MSAVPSWRISVGCSVLNDDREVALRVACGCMNLGQNYAYPGRPNSSDPRESYPLLDHIFDELSRKLPGLSAEQLADNIVANGQTHPECPLELRPNPQRGTGPIHTRAATGRRLLHCRCTY